MERGGIPEDTKLRPTEDCGTFEPPTMEEARKHAIASAPHRIIDKQIVKYRLWRTTSLDLGSLGVGIGLYFETLRLLGYFLLGMSCLHAVILGLCSQAFKSVEQPNIYQPLTGYTLGGMTVDYAVPSSLTFSLAGYSVSKKHVLLATSIIDAVSTILFLACIVYMKYYQRYAVVEMDDATITLGDFGIQVKMLPTGATEADIRAHFSQFGEVADVAIARNDANLLSMLERQQKDVAQLGRLTALIAKTKGREGKDEKARLEEKIIEDEANIAYLIKERPFEVVAAFVTLEDEDARYRCVRSYSDSLIGIFRQPKKLRFLQKKRLAIRAAPEPEDILWENLEIGWGARAARRALSALFTLILLAITTTLMIAAKGYGNRLPPTANCAASAKMGTLDCTNLWNLSTTTGNSDAIRTEVHDLTAHSSELVCRPFVFNGLFLANVTAVAANGTALGLPLPDTSVVQCAAATCYSCYCRSAGLSAFVDDVKGLRTYCKTYWVNLTSLYVFHALAIISAAVINSILFALMPWVSSLERHHLLTSKEAATAKKLFVTQLLNCAVIGTLVYARIAGLHGGKIAGLFFNGLYEDFDTAWYSDVGSTLVITLTIQTVVPSINTVLYTLWAWGKRFLYASSQLTQSDLNKLMEGLNFTLADRHGQLLTLIFVAMVFSSGIPFMMLILTVAIFVTYWVDKTTLLRLSKTPPQYDETMSNSFLSTLPWAAWIHSGVGVWMYGGLPSDTIGQAEDAIGGKIPQPLHQLNWTDRMTKVNAAPLLALFLLLSLYLFARPFYAGARALFALVWRSNQVRDENVTVTLTQALKEQCVSGLPSYQRTENPRYYLAQRTTAAVRAAEAPIIRDRLKVTKSKLPSFLQMLTARGKVVEESKEKLQRAPSRGSAREMGPEEEGENQPRPKRRSSAQRAGEISESVPQQAPKRGTKTGYAEREEESEKGEQEFLSARAAADLAHPEEGHGETRLPAKLRDRLPSEGDHSDSSFTSGPSRNRLLSHFPTSNVKIGR